MDTMCLTQCREEHRANLPDYCMLCNTHRPLLFIDMSALETDPTSALVDHANTVLGELLQYNIT